MTENADHIELRSDEVQEILKRTPHALIRYGISVVFGGMLLIVLGCFFFKYPDIVAGEVTVTTEHPPVWLVARSSGRLQELFFADKAVIKENTLIGVLENTASLSDVRELDSLMSGIHFSDTALHFPRELYYRSLDVGELQSYYSTFIRSVIRYDNFLSANLNSQESKKLRQQLERHRDYMDNLKEQMRLKEEELSVARTAIKREKQLFEQGVISRAEYEQEERNFINRQQSFKQLQTAIITGNTEGMQMYESLERVSLENLHEKNNSLAELRASFRELKTALESWKQTYLLIASVSGQLNFNRTRQKNQFIEAGERVMAVLPEAPGDIVGKIMVPSSGIGKVSEGQPINIKLNGYPYMEYGVLKAQVKNISRVPEEELYMVEAVFINGLTTTTHRQIGFSGELSGVAEIVTDDRSLGQRLIAPLRYVWEEKIE